MNIEQLRSSSSQVDVIVHIDELLGEQGRQDMEYAVQQQQGVRRARFNQVLTHLMVVGYDPKQTNSGAILDRIGRQRVHAQLIGGI